MKIKTLSIDLETYSDIDLTKCGVYKYAESPAFEILLMGVSVNEGPVSVYDIASSEKVPDKILDAIADPGVTKWAYNAAFERVCLSAWMKREYPRRLAANTAFLNPASWRCSMIWGAYLGMPLSLDGIGMVLRLPFQKMSEGSSLIRYFCSPCKPTKANGGRTRNLPLHDSEKWQLFKEYNRRDVEVEQAVQQRLSRFPVPDHVWKEYCLDQHIIDRGIRLDMTLVQQAIKMDERSRNELMTRLQELTGLENPNSVQQMKGWLKLQGITAESLDKKAVQTLLPKVSGTVAEVLQLRQQLAKSSVKKYLAMQNAVCQDGRAHGMFQFYGANRTGRWAGRLIQLQNLPQNHMEHLEQARDLVQQGAYNQLASLYDTVPQVLSELVRTAFTPEPGYKFIVADFSSIEARVLSFLAKENWRLEVFKNNGDIYCASASQMFGVPVEKHGQNAHLRQKGKIAELALGYGGSVGALKSMGALEMGLAESELPFLVEAWREANPNIVQYWRDVDKAVKTAVCERVDNEVGDIGFKYRSGMLIITLPSRRSLFYARPKMGVNKFGGECVTYEGVGAAKKWERISSYGPKFVENIVQGISRDILAFAMKNLSAYRICGHVHDEIILECEPSVTVDEICDRMARTPSWIMGLPLNADGFEAEFYRKD